MAEGEAAVELTTFTAVGDTYVYAPLPPATSYGHRAELWNPDKWMQEVKLKVVTAGDRCFVRMLTRESGELFAEVPLPADGTPLTTAVEPVVDSSRYFVVKVVDRDSRKHAFIGIGFRDRMDASDFTAALDDYRQYLRRKQEAEQLRQEFDSLQPPGGSNSSGSEAAVEGGDAGSSGAQQKDFSLKPGETLHIKLSSGLKRGDSGKAGAAGAAGGILRSGSGGGSSPGIVPPPAPGGIPRLAPPGSTGSSSSSGFFRLQPPPPSPAAAAASGAPAAAAGASDGTQQHESSAGPRRASLDGGSTGAAATSSPESAAAAGSATQPAVPEGDWGAFVG